MAPTELPLPGLISESDMVAHELDVPVVENILNMIFDGEKVWEAKGLESPIKKWYKRVATGSTAVRSRIADGRLSNARSIVWNTKNPWLPENLYFRSNDTCRLLQMSCAVYRVQIYALPSLWSYLEQLAKKRKQDRESGLEGTKQFIVASIIHEVTMLRNFHDFGGSDIPIFVTNWTSTQMDAACDYWATYSEGHWTKEEAKVEYDALNRAHFLPGKSNPCFHQADCLLRALVSDPAAEYLPPFIVLQSILPDGKARAIFTRPQFVPPESLIHDFPRSCQAVDCTNDNCSFFDLDKSFSLADGSPMVRKSLFGDPTVRCNYWPCRNSEARTPVGEKTPKSLLLKCGKCKEVLYCCQKCQTLDWRQHKVICQAAAR